MSLTVKVALCVAIVLAGIFACYVCYRRHRRTLVATRDNGGEDGCSGGGGGGGGGYGGGWGSFFRVWRELRRAAEKQRPKQPQPRKRRATQRTRSSSDNTDSRDSSGSSKNNCHCVGGHAGAGGGGHSCGGGGGRGHGGGGGGGNRDGCALSADAVSADALCLKVGHSVPAEGMDLAVGLPATAQLLYLAQQQLLMQQKQQQHLLKQKQRKRQHHQHRRHQQQEMSWKKLRSVLSAGILRDGLTGSKAARDGHIAPPGRSYLNPLAFALALAPERKPSSFQEPFDEPRKLPPTPLASMCSGSPYGIYDNRMDGGGGWSLIKGRALGDIRGFARPSIRSCPYDSYGNCMGIGGGRLLYNKAPHERRQLPPAPSTQSCRYDDGYDSLSMGAAVGGRGAALLSRAPLGDPRQPPSLMSVHSHMHDRQGSRTAEHYPRRGDVPLPLPPMHIVHKQSGKSHHNNSPVTAGAQSGKIYCNGRKGTDRLLSADGDVCDGVCGGGGAGGGRAIAGGQVCSSRAGSDPSWHRPEELQPRRPGSGGVSGGGEVAASSVVPAAGSEGRRHGRGMPRRLPAPSMAVLSQPPEAPPRLPRSVSMGGAGILKY